MAEGRMYCGKITNEILDVILGPVDLRNTKLNVPLLPVCQFKSTFYNSLLIEFILLNFF